MSCALLRVEMCVCVLVHIRAGPTAEMLGLESLLQARFLSRLVSISLAKKQIAYRGTSLTRTPPPQRPYRRPMPRFLGGSQGVGHFLMGEVPLYGSLKRSESRLAASLLGPVDPSFRALSGRLKFTARRHEFKTDSLPCGRQPWQRSRSGPWCGCLRKVAPPLVHRKKICMSE